MVIYISSLCSVIDNKEKNIWSIIIEMKMNFIMKCSTLDHSWMMW